MKKTLVTTLFLAAISFAGFSQSNDDNKAIAAARAAIKSSCPDAQGNLQANVSVVSACFFTGYIRNVHFYRTPNCPPNQPCIQVIYPIGTVQLDCDNNVIGVTCGSYVTE